MGKKAFQKLPVQRIEAPADKGLSAEAVQERVQKHRVNIAVDPNEKSPLKILATNLFTFFNTVLFSIALIFLGFMIYLGAIGRSDIVDTYFGFSKFVFLIPAIMNVAMGSFQEIKSLSVIRKLRIVTNTKCKVVRDGQVQSVDATEIVLDDIVALTAGEQASADLLVLTGEVEVDESILTGESDYIKKGPGDTILSGSSVIVGAARCRAEKIGDDTYAAELTRKVKSGSRHKSELMTSIMKIIKVLTVGLCIAVAVTTATLIFKISANGSNPAVWDGLTLSLDDPATWSLILLTDGMFGVGMIPTGLVLTTSAALLISIAQLARKKTLIQELYSLENLSRVDVICLDKTGTLTDGTMAVCDIKAFVPIEEINRHAQVLSGVSEDRNATSEAIFQYFGAEENPTVKEIIPFSSAAKYSGVVYEDGRRLLMGAPEYLLPADDPRLSYVTERARQGNRVIAMTLDGELIAFIAIEDHIRDTAADTLRFFKENNVEVKVISGDNPLTVSIIAQKCGIEHADRYISLADVPLEKIPEVAEKYTVFARVSPEQKEALVIALQAQKHKVAMTGDGVNDILALRRADSSITFAKATEAAKSCSDVVLLDNDFSHLKEVVGEGRRVIGNIQKTTVLFLMKSIAMFITAFALIPFAKGQMWFSIENLYMLESAVIGTGGFLLSLEPRRTPVRGSFLKSVVGQSVAAGILVASAILLPLILNTAPKFFGYAPFIADSNVKTMITVLITLAGFVVVFSMCIPFNKYRSFALGAVTFVAVFLGMLVPTAYLGGRAIGAPMLAFNEEAGQSIFDSQFARELFHPMNAKVVQQFFADHNNFIVLRLFLYISIPIFILIRFALENHVRKEYKDIKKYRLQRVGRRMMLSAGFVLMLRSLISIVEMIFSAQELKASQGGAVFADYLTINIGYITIQLITGVIAYTVWFNPTKKRVLVGLVAGISQFVLTSVALLFSGALLSIDGNRLLIDSIVIFIIAADYMIGSMIVYVQYPQIVAKRAERKRL